MLSLAQIRLRWWHQVVLLWLSIFFLLNIVGLIGARVSDLGENFPFHLEITSPYDVPGIWVRWDAGYYISVAMDGYVEHPDTAGFFPLYPILMSALHRVTGINIVVAGSIISNLACLVSTLFLYKIARLIKDDHVFAMRSVLAMLIFPTSFFYFAMYAESLYLVFALVGTYLVLKRRQSFIGGGLALGFASIARPIGWLLDVVMLVEFLRKRRFGLNAFFAFMVGGLLSVIGILLHIYYLYTVLGSFMAIPNAQANWHRQWQIPFMSFWEGLKILWKAPVLRSDWFLYAMNVLDILFTSLAVFVIIVAFLRARKNEFPYSLVIYSGVALLFYLSSQNKLPVPLWGMSRWVASLFPLYFVLGNMFRNNKFQFSYFLGSASLLLFFTAWWTSGRWIG